MTAIIGHAISQVQNCVTVRGQLHQHPHHKMDVSYVSPPSYGH